MEGETHEDVVLYIHQNPWHVRTYNGGRWQVYGHWLFHVADFAPDQQAEAERLCDMHNEALEMLNPKGKPKPVVLKEPVIFKTTRINKKMSEITAMDIPPGLDARDVASDG